MTSVNKITVGKINTNCYLFFNKFKDCYIIDPGDEAEKIIAKIKQLSLKPQAILATHGHFDHILAVQKLKKTYSIPFYLHQNDLQVLKNMQRDLKFFTGAKISNTKIIDLEANASNQIPKVDKKLTNHDILKLNDAELKVISTPGHTNGSVIFYCKKKKLAFTGDTIFANGYYGRTDLEGGDAQALRQSLDKISKLPKNIALYPGHGAFTTIKNELNLTSLNNVL